MKTQRLRGHPASRASVEIETLDPTFRACPQPYRDGTGCLTVHVGSLCREMKLLEASLIILALKETRAELV